MPLYKGRWTARVSQDFELDAETEEEAQELLYEHECLPQHVVELLDITIESIEEVERA